MKVVVQTNDCPGLTVPPVALDHLAALWEPFSTIGLDEESTLIAMNVGVDDQNSVDFLGWGDSCHEVLGERCCRSSRTEARLVATRSLTPEHPSDHGLVVDKKPPNRARERE